MSAEKLFRAWLSDYIPLGTVSSFHNLKSAFLAGRASKKDRCPCGDIILADTEDLKVPLCYECADETVKAMGKSNE